jgi:hypothetical protein
MLRIAFLVLIPVAAAGCAVAPPPDGLIAAADPAARVPAIRYQNVAGATTSYRPVGPRAWEDINGEITLKTPATAPAGKPQTMPGMKDGGDP